MLFLILSPFFCLSDHRYFEHFSTLQNVWNEKGVGAVCMLVGVCVQRGKVLNRKRSAWQPPGEAGPVTAAPHRSSGRLPEVGHGKQMKTGPEWLLRPLSSARSEGADALPSTRRRAGRTLCRRSTSVPGEKELWSPLCQRLSSSPTARPLTKGRRVSLGNELSRAGEDNFCLMGSE